MNKCANKMMSNTFNLLKINNKQEFIQVVTYLIDKIGMDITIKKARLNYMASEIRKQQSVPDFKDKTKNISTTLGSDIEPVYTLTPKESLKSLAEQLGYIK